MFHYVQISIFITVNIDSGGLGFDSRFWCWLPWRGPYGFTQYLLYNDIKTDHDCFLSHYSEIIIPIHPPTRRYVSYTVEETFTNTFKSSIHENQWVTFSCSK